MRIMKYLQDQEQYSVYRRRKICTVQHVQLQGGGIEAPTRCVEEQEYSLMKVWEAAEIEAPSRRGVNSKNEETESSRNKGP